MAFVALVVELQADEGERLSEALLDAGALSVSGEDAASGTPAEIPRYDEPGESAFWPNVKLVALLRAQDDPVRILDLACMSAGVGRPAFELLAVDDEDWVRKSREQFEPVRISDRLWIVPSWHAPRPGAINIVLDPGLAFGTGSHPTTRLCLAWLERHVSGGETVLDYGCGSGILAIAALKLGAARAFGTDIDPVSVLAARANAGQNGVTAEFFPPESLPPLSADLVVANILANPLKLLAPLLAGLCARGGRIALSGILSPQASDVAAAWSPWFDFEPAIAEGEWICLSGARR